MKDKIWAVQTGDFSRRALLKTMIDDLNIARTEMREALSKGDDPRAERFHLIRAGTTIEDIFTGMKELVR